MTSSTKRSSNLFWAESTQHTLRTLDILSFDFLAQKMNERRKALFRKEFGSHRSSRRLVHKHLHVHKEHQKSSKQGEIYCKTPFSSHYIVTITSSAISSQYAKRSMFRESFASTRFLAPSIPGPHCCILASLQVFNERCTRRSF